MMPTVEAPWDAMQLALLAAAFLAAALGLEGLVLLWHQTRSPAVQRLRRRLKAWLPEQEPSGPGAATGRPVADSNRRSAIVEWLTARWRRRPAALRPLVAQLPDALDLMARALRSGHSFASALQMVADDGPQPLAVEFRQVAEHIALGGEADQAFEALAQRVPVDEMRFFVMAVRLQRQTGGQLAEVLGNIAQLVRQRLQLRDKVRVLTAEGRLSAQILAALPPVTAGALLLIRPEFMALLWTDPAGLRLLQGSAVLMAAGGLWLWRLTRLRL